MANLRLFSAHRLPGGAKVYFYKLQTDACSRRFFLVHRTFPDDRKITYRSHRIRRRRPVRCDREYLLTRPSPIVDARTTQVTRILDILSPLQVPARPPFTRPLENKFYRMSRFTLLYRVLHQ